MPTFAASAAPDWAAISIIAGAVVSVLTVLVSLSRNRTDRYTALVDTALHLDERDQKRDQRVKAEMREEFERRISTLETQLADCERARAEMLRGLRDE